MRTLLTTCTSGGNMSATFSQSQGRRARSGRTRVTFRYAKARVGADTKAPRPGACAWQHRALNPREPAVATLPVAEAGFTRVTASKGGLGVRFSDRDLDKLMGYVSKPGRRFSLVVANPGGRLVIERVH